MRLTILALLSIVLLSNSIAIAKENHQSNRKGQNKFKRLKAAVEVNTNAIEANNIAIQENKEAIAALQAPPSNYPLEVHVDGYGSIGQLLIGHISSNGNAVIKGTDGLFILDSTWLALQNVYFYDPECTQPLVRAYLAVYRNFGQLLAGINEFTGQAYSIDSNSQRVEVETLYKLSDHEPDTGQPLSSPECFEEVYFNPNENPFYRVQEAEVPSFFRRFSNTGNIYPRFYYRLDGDMTLIYGE
ncbi:hypothetical protein [Aliikangiella sp. IMCC44632]